jgi:sarcosine oxidase subunit beta
MSESHDTVIIGAGIIGCAIAYGLAARGRRVLVVDKNPAAGYGSTSSSAAVIRTFYSTRAGCALAWEGLHYWRDWAGFLGVEDERGMVRFVECGCLVLRPDGPDGMAGALPHLDALGIAWDWWDADQVAARLPGLDLRRFGPPKRHDDPDFGTPAGGDVAGGYFFPDGGFVTDPQLATHNLQAAAEAAGARFRFNTRVSGVVRNGGRVAGVDLDGGETLRAPVVVNAAGPYSAIVNAMAGVLDGMNIQTRPLRQEISTLRAPAELTLAQGGLMVADADIGNYMRPEVGDALLIGSMEPDCDPLVWIDDPDSLDRSPSDQWTAQVYRQALRVPELAIPNQATSVVDLYDVADDWIPIYDKSDLPGFYLAVGTSGNQFKNGPVAGQLMAGLIEHCEAGRDQDAEPHRFPFRYTEGEVDTAAFSRRREASRESSMSVLG